MPGYMRITSKLTKEGIFLTCLFNRRNAIWFPGLIKSLFEFNNYPDFRVY